MPLTHTSAFKVRYYECDAYGHVNNTNYLRYMQEAAFEASAAAGYDTARYEAMGRAWFIRGTDIEYLRPLKYGETVEVKTWVQDFRRVTSRRAYELRAQPSGDLVARAFSDWAFVGAQTWQPARAPDEMSAAFKVEGDPPPREKFPMQPPPPNGAFRLRRLTRFRDIDQAQHVNNAVYADYFEDAGVYCVAHFGWPMSRMQDLGFGIVYRRAWIEYLTPAVFDDELDITAWLSDVKRVSALRHFTATRVSDGALVARMSALGVAANLNTGAPTRFLPEMIADFAPNIAI